jgi:hypothetical protein
VVALVAANPRTSIMGVVLIVVVLIGSPQQYGGLNGAASGNSGMSC